MAKNRQDFMSSILSTRSSPSTEFIATRFRATRDVQYRGLCLLYRSLLFDRNYLERQPPKKLLIARNYFVNVLKRTYVSIVGM